MDEIKIMSDVDFNGIVSEHTFQKPLLLKDYYLTIILYLIKDVGGIYFKGGTALNKIFLDHARLSEDVDFALERNEKEVRDEIRSILEGADFVSSVSEDKNVDGFLRMVVKCRSDLGESEIFIDLNNRGKVSLHPQSHKIGHFYEPFLPGFSVNTLAVEEMIAEKVAATIGRNKPRDHFDIYNIIRAKMPIDLALARKKCADSNVEFSIIKMFNKAKTLKNRWDKDMVPLLADPVSFQDVIKSLAKHFNLQEEKGKVKKRRKIPI
jgi:predicted nucleotidyltransferase component of viral defense system